MTDATTITTTDPAAGLGPAIGQALTADQLAGARETWIKAGGDPARFDGAVAADGYLPPVAADAATVKLFEEHGLAHQARPSEYRPSFGPLASERTTEQLAATSAELTEWCSQMGFAPGYGRDLLEHLIQLGPKLAAMTEGEREEWTRQQERDGLAIMSEEKLADLRTRALAALKLVPNSKFADSLSKTPAMHDMTLLVALAHHADAHALATKTRS